VIVHLVLFTPRVDLSPDERRRVASALAEATRGIPSVRRVRVGRLMRHGAGYEQTQASAPELAALIEFDDLAGLQAYLAHALHEPLATLLDASVSSMAAYDYEIGGLEFLADLVEEAPA
jgi:hypothetical protein